MQQQTLKIENRLGNSIQRAHQSTKTISQHFGEFVVAWNIDARLPSSLSLQKIYIYINICARMLVSACMYTHIHIDTNIHTCMYLHIHV